MNSLVFLDYLLIAAAVAASWKLLHTAQPPPAGVESKQGLLLGPAPAGEMVRQQRASLDEVLTPLSETLKRICTASGYSGITTFLDGAKLSYEAIIKGFASGNIAPLTFLLSRRVYDDFARAVRERDERGEIIEMTFIGFRAAEVTDAGIENGSAWIEVRFVGDLISATRDRDGRIVAGHQAMIVEVAELWTFERELRSSQPHWVLVATEPDE